MIERGDVWWADLAEPLGSEPGWRRPVVVVQSDAFNRSRIATVIVAIVTTNLRLLDAPGNVLLPARAAGLRADSVVNVSQVVTIDRSTLTDRAGRVPASTMREIDRGLRLVLSL